MTPSELKQKVDASGNEPYFFTNDTMKYFGDTMSNYGVRTGCIKTLNKPNVQVWVLYRKHAVKCGLRASAYFNTETFEQEFERN